MVLGHALTQLLNGKRKKYRDDLAGDESPEVLLERVCHDNIPNLVMEKMKGANFGWSTGYEEAEGVPLTTGMILSDREFGSAVVLLGALVMDSESGVDVLVRYVGLSSNMLVGLLLLCRAGSLVGELAPIFTFAQNPTPLIDVRAFERQTRSLHFPEAREREETDREPMDIDDVYSTLGTTTGERRGPCGGSN